MQLPPAVHRDLPAIRGARVDGFTQREQVELVIRDSKSIGRNGRKIRLQHPHSAAGRHFRSELHHQQ